MCKQQHCCHIVGYLPCSYLPWLLAAVICRGYSSWGFAVSLCCDSLPWLLAVGICRVNLLEVWKRFLSRRLLFYMNKNYFYLRFFLVHLMAVIDHCSVYIFYLYSENISRFTLIFEKWFPKTFKIHSK